LEQEARDKAERIRVEREKKRLFEEEVKLADWRKQYAECYTKHIGLKVEKENWDQFFRCDPMPKANKERQITSFLTEYSIPYKIESVDVKEFLQRCEYTEKILENIQTLKYKAQSELDLNTEKIHKTHIKLYRNKTQSHFDEITSYFAINCD